MATCQKGMVCPWWLPPQGFCALIDPVGVGEGVCVLVEHVGWQATDANFYGTTSPTDDTTPSGTVFRLIPSGNAGRPGQRDAHHAGGHGRDGQHFRDARRRDLDRLRRRAGAGGEQRIRPHRLVHGHAAVRNPAGPRRCGHPVAQAPRGVASALRGGRAWWATDLGRPGRPGKPHERRGPLAARGWDVWSPG